MKLKKIDGIVFDRMLRNGLYNLQASEEEVNNLNVFPVADGDTATNMLRTLENGLKSAKAVPPMGAYLKQLSGGMLLGARGNSGVILSQIFRGIFQALTHCGSVSPSMLRDALVRGYKTAYDAVAQPVEGTILTVAREGIEHIRYQIDRSTTIDGLLSMYLAEMRKTLAHTPEMLPILKKSGVVDSGALGYILIVEGMLKFLHGKTLTPSAPAAPASTEGQAQPSQELFNENSPFEEGYCMEFILQLMNGRHYAGHFDLDRYIEALKRYGTSIATAQSGKRVKVHVHTHVPARIMDLSQEYGEFLSFKLDNMQLQHNEVLSRQAASENHKPLAVVAVVNGTGMAELFQSLGCDHVLDGGSTMNTSSQEFLDVFQKANADHIVVLPNNKNTVLAAQQAATLSGQNNITVIPTASMVEGYFAVAMDTPTSDDVDYRIQQMQEGGASIHTVFTTAASRDYACREISCRTGDQIALVDGELVCVSDNWLSVLLDGLERVPDLDDKEVCVVFRGAARPQEDQEELAKELQARYPLLEINYIDGGQSVYEWMLGVL